MKGHTESFTAYTLNRQGTIEEEEEEEEESNTTLPMTVDNCLCT